MRAGSRTSRAAAGALAMASKPRISQDARVRATGHLRAWRPRSSLGDEMPDTKWKRVAIGNAHMPPADTRAVREGAGDGLHFTRGTVDEIGRGLRGSLEEARGRPRGLHRRDRRRRDRDDAASGLAAYVGGIEAPG